MATGVDTRVINFHYKFDKTGSLFIYPRVEYSNVELCTKVRLPVGCSMYFDNLGKIRAFSVPGTRVSPGAFPPDKKTGVLKFTYDEETDVLYIKVPMDDTGPHCYSYAYPDDNLDIVVDTTTDNIVTGIEVIAAGKMINMD